LWRSSHIHDEIAEGLRFHIDQRTDENRRSGMSPDDARTDALRRFGPRLQIREQGYPQDSVVTATKNRRQTATRIRLRLVQH
jgi:hypothetical protein